MEIYYPNQIFCLKVPTSPLPVCTGTTRLWCPCSRGLGVDPRAQSAQSLRPSVCPLTPCSLALMPSILDFLIGKRGLILRVLTELDHLTPRPAQNTPWSMTGIAALLPLRWVQVSCEPFRLFAVKTTQWSGPGLSVADGHVSGQCTRVMLNGIVQSWPCVFWST